MRRTTRSRPAGKPTAAALGIDPEVEYYLKTRGIPLPDCPPAIQTPSPGKVRGAKFDPMRVDRIMAAFGQLRHTQGRWAGRPLNPDPWQVAYVIAPVFGWVRFDREIDQWVRIVRNLWVEVPRKNGKTTLSGGIALYLMAGDGEAGAQVYAAAASLRQASYLFNPIRDLASRSPGLAKYMKVVKQTISHPGSMSTFTVISSVADAMHGANVHGSVVDEVHVHKDGGELIEAIETGTGSRAQPLNVNITTADNGKPGTIYARKRHRIEQLARRVVRDPTTYGVIWAASERDDPFAEDTWRKANPGYGVSPTKAYLKSKADAARQSPAELAAFKRLHLGIRTRQETKYFELAAWDANAGLVDVATLAGREAYGGLDLSSTTDLTAWALLFPDDDGGYDVLVRLFAPEARLEDLDRRTAGEASVWVQRGQLTLTPGNVVDYDFVRECVNADRETFDVRSIGYDPWNSSALVTNLMGDGATLAKVRQGFATMSPPTKELLRLLLTGTPKAPLLRHGGNGALRWMADNFTVATDAAGNVKPDKSKAADHIDGVAAIITALTEAMTREPAAISAYAHDSGDLMVVD